VVWILSIYSSTEMIKNSNGTIVAECEHSISISY
jgi:hypothetical protein